MKRILRMVDKETGQFAEGEIGVWLAALVAALPEDRRDAVFDFVRNDGSLPYHQPVALVHRGDLPNLSFILAEYDG